ncbi:MAG: hypothetical protein ACT6UH_03570 [Hydrogenophaga sp.]|uniref:hypothetical protein n=1 Tax=Hydrogenophaga sp. TaxID=1904254 RepID=UPI00403500E4
MNVEPGGQKSDFPIPNLVGERIRSRREELVWPQEKLGAAIDIDESSAKKTMRLICC